MKIIDIQNYDPFRGGTGNNAIIILSDVWLECAIFQDNRDVLKGVGPTLSIFISVTNFRMYKVWTKSDYPSDFVTKIVTFNVRSSASEPILPISKQDRII